MNNPGNSTLAYRPAASFRACELIIGIFVTVLIVSNIASSAKIVDWASAGSGCAWRSTVARDRYWQQAAG
jgi:hypothetical protein